MKLNEISDSTYHNNITNWLTRAAALALRELERIMREESKKDPFWFIVKRGNQIPQLVSEVFTLALYEVSDNKWSLADFEGRKHSDLLARSIDNITRSITPYYHKLRADTLEHNTTAKQE